MSDSDIEVQRAQNQVYVPPTGGPDPTKMFVFVDVDTQHDFVDPSGAMHTPGADGIAEDVRRLVAFAAANRIPVISTVDAHRPGDKELKEHPAHCLVGTPGAQKVEGTTLPGAVTLPSTPADVPSPLPPQVILEKQTLDVFDNRNAAKVVEQVYGRTAIVFGVAVDCCVKITVQGLRARGLPCRVVKDAVAGIDTESGQTGAREIIETGALLMTTDETLAVVEKQLATQSP